jgi:hypothetical protein
MELIMKSIVTFLVLALLIIPSALQAKQTKYKFEETVSITLPRTYFANWKLCYQKTYEAGAAVTRYILETETMDNWTQLINIQFKDRKLIESSNAMEVMRQEATFNKWVTYKIHTQSPNDLIYEKIFPTGEHEVVRMIMTEKGLHRIGYAKRDAPFTEAERARWVELLSSGTINKIE